MTVGYKELIMNTHGQEFYWAGTYSFKPEIKMFLEAVRKQIDEILGKIEHIEKAIERN